MNTELRTQTEIRESLLATAPDRVTAPAALDAFAYAFPVDVARIRASAAPRKRRCSALIPRRAA